MIKSIKIIGDNLVGSLRLLRKHSSLSMPFLWLAIAESIWLAICYYMPRPPVSLVLAPPIKVFMGEQFLHYPFNFLVMPRLVFIGRVFIYLSAGLIALGMSIGSIAQVEHEKTQVRFWGNLNRALRYYPALLASGLMYAIFAFCIYKIPRLAVAKAGLSASLLKPVSTLVFIVTFLLLVLLEAILIYIPISILVNRFKLFSAVKQALRFSGKCFMSSFLFMLVFRSLNAIIFFWKGNIKHIIETYFPAFPEITLFILGAEIIFLFLANLFIVVFACRLYVFYGDIKI